MRIDPDFLKHSIRLRIEGFEQQKLLSSCMRQGIPLRSVSVENEISMLITIRKEDLPAVRKLAGSRYRITQIRERGAGPMAGRFFAKKSTAVGLVIFALLIFYQSSFVSEINIYGYERLQEMEIREALKEEGLFEGADKSLNLEAVEGAMYDRLDNLSWIGIKYIGNLVEVSVVEGSSIPEQADESLPSHVVANKAGYLEKIIPREGQAVLPKGSYVKPGDIVITGLLPIDDKTFQVKDSSTLFRTVHAKGEVWARILYRMDRYQNRYELLKKETGRHFYGISFQLGSFHWDSSDFFWPYNSAVREDQRILQTVRPLPLELSLTRLSEVELYKKERSQEEIRQLAATQGREAIKENIPKNTQILNNSLKFSTKENIIEVTIMLHALEEIGKEQTFNRITTDSGIEKNTGGATTFGKSTE